MSPSAVLLVERLVRGEYLTERSMRIPFIDLAAQFAEVEPEVRSAIDGVFESCAFVGGPAVEQFEHRFAQYCRTEHCVAVGSGTAALEILLRTHGVGSGDEVILPANAFVAAAEAVSLAGARPVFADVRGDTANLDPESLTRAMTQKTKGIIPVHLYGQPANMEPILELARRRSVFVIEDCGQAHGATLNGRRAGNLADAAAFSFYPSKNLGAYGEGGCVTTNDASIAERARMLRDHGSSRKHY
ncbi:MAG: DegT/DnrJ/EryC1/StrS family aminotransferase, partial [Woeseiaceae bacterium]